MGGSYLLSRTLDSPPLGSIRIAWLVHSCQTKEPCSRYVQQPRGVRSRVDQQLPLDLACAEIVA